MAPIFPAIAILSALLVNDSFDSMRQSFSRTGRFLLPGVLSMILGLYLVVHAGRYIVGTGIRLSWERETIALDQLATDELLVSKKDPDHRVVQYCMNFQYPEFKKIRFREMYYLERMHPISLKTCDEDTLMKTVESSTSLTVVVPDSRREVVNRLNDHCSYEQVALDFARLRPRKNWVTKLHLFRFGRRCSMNGDAPQ